MLVSVPSVSEPLLWESSYQCGADDGADEFGFITGSAPPALTLLPQEVIRGCDTPEAADFAPVGLRQYYLLSPPQAGVRLWG